MKIGFRLAGPVVGKNDDCCIVDAAVDAVFEIVELGYIEVGELIPCSLRVADF